MANITRILFIGNSFTARNDLPGLLAQLVHAGGKGELECELISAGGASLRMHLNKGEAHERLQASRWDYVVLQEQSTLPVKNPTRTGENIREFDAIIKAAQAQTVLYMTWARQNAPETQAALSETYIEVGREIGATVVPVGLAWRDCLESHPDIVLHDKDQSHPNLAGSYLAACTFYATLFIGRSKSIPNIDIDLDAETINALHEAALATMRT
ncbi:MAG: hypothetical protein F4Z57_13680 [Gemmatimonadetes bacterium]|nr:hypothetical protein [Gemmatimonadota bacterium]MYC73795.1 hypothetical protein [Gemmatimonadota bacterium]MYI61323.1 hypothetical protein [Gemmatimonadota bacterium]